MNNVNLTQWLNFVLYGLILLKAKGSIVGITYVQNATVKGAVCLDGSQPAYHLDRGSGTGVNSWLVQLEGGGWCNNVTSCIARMNSGLGSSKLMANQIGFSGILSNKPQYNPDFYNWNRVKIRYCDGSSFTGDIEEVNPETNLHFRGARVWIAVIEDLLIKGMRHAENDVQLVGWLPFSIVMASDHSFRSLPTLNVFPMLVSSSTREMFREHNISEPTLVKLLKHMDR